MLTNNLHTTERHGADSARPEPIPGVSRAALDGARQLAVDETGAVIVHRLVEPLTALLLYIHELKGVADDAGPTERDAAHQLVESALRETERVCAIVEQIGSAFAARGSEVAPSPRPSQPEPPQSNASRTLEHQLTAREREVLTLICAGATSKEGALQLRISPRTVESHRAKIMRKFGARNAADLLRMVLVEAR